LVKTAGEAGSFTRGRAPRGVAQIFNLLYRRFVTCEARRCGGQPADGKSAIQQAANLR
jgi:hypothetical protein